MNTKNTFNEAEWIVKVTNNYGTFIDLPTDQQTEAICLAAVKQNGNLLFLVKNQTEEICLEALKTGCNAMQYIKNTELRERVAKAKTEEHMNRNVRESQIERDTKIFDAYAQAALTGLCAKLVPPTDSHVPLHQAESIVSDALYLARYAMKHRKLELARVLGNS